MPLTLPMSVHGVAAVVCVVAAAVMLRHATTAATRWAHGVTLVVMIALAALGHAGSGLAGSGLAGSGLAGSGHAPAMLSAGPVAFGALVLAVVAAALACGRGGREARTCAVDSAACSAAVGLMAAPLLLAATGSHAGAGGSAAATGGGAGGGAGEDLHGGLHGHVHQLVPGGADHQLLLGLALVLVVVAWAWARRGSSASLPTSRGGSPAPTAPMAAMLLAMGAMAVG